jgi:RNA polymerase sigma-70 factor (ECF subfamily)
MPRPHPTAGLFEATYDDLVRFAQRRVPAAQAEDIVADAFLVAWRRTDDAPQELADARAWLFGIARNVILNTQRGTRRQHAVAVRLAEAPPSALDDNAELVAQQIDLSRAWSRLTDVHQEALALAVLDSLNAPQAAAVLGISPVAFRLRLSRARRALRSLLGHLPAPTPERHPS